MRLGIARALFANRVESANLHLDIDRNQLDIWVYGTGIYLHLSKVLLERKHHLVVLYITFGVEVDFWGVDEALTSMEISKHGPLV